MTDFFSEILPKKTELGDLRIIRVYEFLDCPRLFIAQNHDGIKYLAYWFHETDAATGWLYVQVTDEIIEQLENRKLFISEAYTGSLRGYYLVYTRGFLEDVVLHKTSFNWWLFPPYGSFIEYIEDIE